MRKKLFFNRNTKSLDLNSSSLSKKKNNRRTRRLRIFDIERSETKETSLIIKPNLKINLRTSIVCNKSRKKWD